MASLKCLFRCALIVTLTWTLTPPGVGAVVHIPILAGRPRPGSAGVWGGASLSTGGHWFGGGRRAAEDDSASVGSRIRAEGSGEDLFFEDDDAEGGYMFDRGRFSGDGKDVAVLPNAPEDDGHFPSPDLHNAPVYDTEGSAGLGRTSVEFPAPVPLPDALPLPAPRPASTTRRRAGVPWPTEQYGPASACRQELRDLLLCRAETLVMRQLLLNSQDRQTETSAEPPETTPKQTMGGQQQVPGGHQQTAAAIAELRRGQRQLMAGLAALQERVAALHPDRGCPPGWSRAGRACFLIPPVRASWHVAGRTCALMDPRARLASVHPDNADTVKNMFAGSDTDFVWIGLARVGENDWAWTDGSDLDYTNWRKGEPNNWGGVENCVHGFGSSQTTTGWNDRPCSDQTSFLCQISLH